MHCFYSSSHYTTCMLNKLNSTAIKDMDTLNNVTCITQSKTRQKSKTFVNGWFAQRGPTWLTFLGEAEDPGSVIFVSARGVLVPPAVCTLTQARLRAAALHVTHQNGPLVFTVGRDLIRHPSTEALAPAHHRRLPPAPAVHTDAAPDALYVDHDLTVRVCMFVISVQRQVEPCLIQKFRIWVNMKLVLLNTISNYIVLSDVIWNWFYWIV